MKKVKLLNLPTPLHQINVDNKNNYYIKRDDLTDFGLGGNKARKMEYFLADILDKGSDYIVTYGSIQSNHCRITALAASKFNLKCLLILNGKEEEFKYNGNDIFYKLTGAKICLCNSNDVKSRIDEEMKKLIKKGYNPYFIAGGGHGNIGTYAYYSAYTELMTQTLELGIKFDYIFLASGTGTTQAGLIVGKHLYGSKERIVGISIARKAFRGIEVIRDSLMEFDIEFKTKSSSEEIIFIDDFVGNGYGTFTKDIAETIQNVLIKNSVILDTTYTGKAFNGMIKYLENNNIKDKNILFIHTGGTPIFFSKGKELVKYYNNEV